jgi:hypothetical protein
VDPADIAFPQTEVCPIRFDGDPWCLGETLVGTGSPQNGSVDPDTGQIDIPFSVNVELDALTGFDGLDSGCQIGSIETTLVATDYDEVTGNATLIANDIDVPAVTTCGTDWNALLNEYLSLPGEADISFSVQILDGDGDPIQID